MAQLDNATDSDSGEWGFKSLRAGQKRTPYGVSFFGMYQKIKTIRKNNGYTRKGNKISNENLYKHYSIKGIHGGNGNFLSYVKREKSCFGNNENIEISTKNHMQKISKALKSKNRK